MSGRSRKLLTSTTVLIGGGTPAEARRKEAEAALRTLPSQSELPVRLQRFTGEMSFTYSDGSYEAAHEWADGIRYGPFRVTLKEASDIARIFVDLGMLHEGYSWRERA